MRQDFFGIPIFQDVVDLSKIKLLDKELKPTFRSRIKSSFLTEREVKKPKIIEKGKFGEDGWSISIGDVKDGDT